jgi:molybdate transport system regulatory protein
MKPSLRLRLVLADKGAIGPGKADLLAAFEAEGSISAASRSMGMSYPRYVVPDRRA